MKRVSACAIMALLAVGLPAQADMNDFPSADSIVVGSVGFIDGSQVGYFWDANRGDSVTETFADPTPSVNRMLLDVEVVENALNSGAFVNWDVLLNGNVVGNFTVNEGELGERNFDFAFAPINSPGNYTVRVEVTNVVAGGQGSHTLAYAGDFAHAVTLIPEPGSIALLALGCVLLRRGR